MLKNKIVYTYICIYIYILRVHQISYFVAKISKPISDMVTVGQLKTMSAPEVSIDTKDVVDPITSSFTKTLGGEGDNSIVVVANDTNMIESVNHPTKEDVDIKNYNATSKGSRRGSSFGW